MVSAIHQEGAVTEPGNAASAPLTAVAAERRAQEARWGVQRHSWPEWIAILTEEVGEASREAIEQHWRPTADLTRLRSELVQVAAVAVAMIEHVDALADLDRDA